MPARARRTKRPPLHLFLEECQEYVPQRLQKGEERMFGAVRRIVRLGRGDGFGISLIPQRPQSINKEVLTQCELLVCFQVTHKLDRRALDDWVEAQDTEGHREEFMDGLAGLQRGEGWVWSPAWLQTFARGRFRENATYDSSATPTAGGTATAPQVMAAVDLVALRQRMAATVERAQANDPRALRQQIAGLKRHLAAAKAAQPAPQVERVDVLVFTDAMRDELQAILAQGQALGTDLQLIAAGFTQRIPAIETAPPAPAAAPPKPARRRAPVAPPSSPAPAREPPLKLRAGAQRMLATLVAFAATPLTRQQLGTLAMIRSTGGTFNAYLGDLRRAGLIEEVDTLLRPTAAGIAQAGPAPAPVRSVEALLNGYKQLLRAGARRMLDALTPSTQMAIAAPSSGLPPPSTPAAAPSAPTSRTCAAANSSWRKEASSA